MRGVEYRGKSVGINRFTELGKSKSGKAVKLLRDDGYEAYCPNWMWAEMKYAAEEDWASGRDEEWACRLDDDLTWRREDPDDYA